MTLLEALDHFTQRILFDYSEWLDSQGLVTSDSGLDKRSHEELVKDFINGN